MRRARGSVTPERLELAREAATLRGLGLLIEEIADALGISRTYTSALLHDPDGSKARERKARYAQPCLDCGAPTSGCEGRREEPRCLQCAAARGGEARTWWTPQRIIDRIREWADLYGEPPAMADWNPHQAREQLGDEERARRWEDAGGYWPWFTSVVYRFGSWSDGLEAAGFERRAPNGGGGNNFRRRRKVAA